MEQLEKTIFEIKASRFAKGNLIFPPTLTVYGGCIDYNKKHFQIPIPLFNKEGTWSFIGTDHVNVKVSDIAFFNIQGMAKKRLYFGYYDQIEISGISKDDAKKLYDYCKDNGSKLSHEGQTYKSSGPFLSIMRRIHPEYITLADEAVIYFHKTFKGNSTTYLPYKQITFNFTDKGFFSQRINVLGEQNISTKYGFSKTCARVLKERFEKYGVPSLSGKAYKPFFSLKYLFGSKPGAYCTNDGLIWVNKREKQLYNLKDEDLRCYEVIRNGFLFKTIRITAFVGNIRKDQAGALETFVLPGLFFTNWGFLFWSFGFKKVLESKGCEKAKKK
jgi:hypothetical protein